MKKDGYSPDLMHACHNRTVVIDAHMGERENKQLPVVEAHGLRNIHIYEGEEWINIRDAVGRSDEGVSLPERGLPEGVHDSAPVHRREHHSSADGENARLHHDDRRDEERVRRIAERAPALDASGHPRNARRSADDSAENPSRRLRGDGRHIRRRRSRTALYDSARQERHPGERRSGRHRRDIGEADGHGPVVDQVHPPCARARARLRRSARHRDRRRRGRRRRELAFRRAVPEDDVRRAHAAPDLLGTAAQADRVVVENSAGAMGLRRERRLSRQLLVSAQSESADARRAGQPVGTAVPRMGNCGGQ